jgi:hypothetical protein
VSFFANMDRAGALLFTLPSLRFQSSRKLQPHGLALTLHEKEASISTHGYGYIVVYVLLYVLSFQSPATFNALAQATSHALGLTIRFSPVIFSFQRLFRMRFSRSPVAFLLLAETTENVAS